jgi:hypothetical protein
MYNGLCQVIVLEVDYFGWEASDIINLHHLNIKHLHLLRRK